MIRLFLFVIFISNFHGAIAGEKYGDWNFDDSVEDYHFANTARGGKVTGVICNLASKSCNAYLGTGDTCTVKSEIPVMINSSVGAALATGTCIAFGDKYYIEFKELTSINETFESGGEIGFAVPLDGGNFKSIRFSTKGAVPAIRRAMTLPANKPNRQNDQLF